MLLLTWSGEKEIVTKNVIFDLKWRNDNVAAGSARTGGLLVLFNNELFIKHLSYVNQKYHVINVRIGKSCK